MAYPMTDEDRAIQDKMRRFVDEELIPFEVEAEMSGGLIPAEAEERQKGKLREMGFSAINMPKEL
ncbi:MAG: acyl-CoA dehydrogenase family protein, partial [Actinomycetota bacterium]